MGNTVFISWSGERSRYVAEALRGWLPVVLQTVKPWMSADVEKGTRWETEISARLDEADVGIICLTPENLSSPWLLFEAGALSKKLTKSRVCTYLLDLTPAEVPPPMGMFQHTVFGRDDTRKLLDSINSAQAQPIGKEILDTSFGALWPSLEGKLKDIPPAQEPTKPVRKVEDMVEELLAITRALPHVVSAQIGILEVQRRVEAIDAVIQAATTAPSAPANTAGGLLPGRYKSAGASASEVLLSSQGFRP